MSANDPKQTPEVLKPTRTNSETAKELFLNVAVGVELLDVSP